MQWTLLKSKLHRVSITDANVDYEGSITLDEALMEAAEIVEYEKVLVGNITNGNRFETYAIKGPRGSGVVCLNGATAHLGKAGDIATIFTFTQLKKKELTSHKPLIVHVDQRNRVVEKRHNIERPTLIRAL